MAAKLGPLSFQSQKYYFVTPSSAALPLMVTTSVGSPRSTFMASSTLHSSTATSTRKQADKNLKRSSIGRNYEAVEVVPNNKSCVLVEKMEVIKAMEDWAEKNILIHLKPVNKCWQPQDFLPDSCCYKDHSDGRLLFLEQIKELRERTKEIPDDYFVVLVGDMITEEALPTYQTRFNCMQGIWDDTGVSTSPWAVWSRAWTAEENRHGDLLNKYLYLSGRVDMKQVEKTIQHLIGTGMDIGTENDPYKWFIYTSFQERATFIAHGNTARLAMKHGDRSLAQICGLIASDEKRHEIAYTKVVEKLFEMDPDNTVVAFADMMRKKITMPAHLLYDGRDHTLFQHFSAVASRIGVYTALDYIHILEHLVEKWNVPKLTGLSAEGRKAQDYVCRLAPRLLLIKERAQEMAKLQERPPISSVTFSWIFDKQVSL